MTEKLQSPDKIPAKEPGWFAARKRAFFTLHALDIQIYRVCDDLSGVLIFAMLIFSPWAFGTTDLWAIRVMTMAGDVAGALLLVKLFIRAKGYAAPSWENFSARSGTFSLRRGRIAHLLTRSLAILTLTVLAYCLVSAWNVAAYYDYDDRLFQYQHYIAWLPHSFDGQRSWTYFWRYLALAGTFWAVADWLTGMTPEEERRALGAARKEDSERTVPLLPTRLRRLLWLLCVNGALLGLEAIVQRAAGSNKLLFLVQPIVHFTGESQFGPYAYRSNAAQYFNMLWPVCLGFWWTLQRTGGGRGCHWLVLCAAIMASCPIISTSRAGALVAAAMLVLAFFYLGAASITALARRGGTGMSRWAAPVLLGLFLTATIATGWYFGWDLLSPRLEQIGQGYQDREAMYTAAQPMTKDFPVFGTGPGTFLSVFQLYRFSDETYWPGQLHNDWLETRITFGWFGFILLLAALGVVILHGFTPGAKRGNRRLVMLSWLALGGCLIEAMFDFPFQVHSTLFTFLVICAVLCGLSRIHRPTRH